MHPGSKLSLVSALGFLVTGLLLSSASHAQTGVILIPGAGGATPIDFVMRNQARISSAGFQTFVATSPREVAGVARSLRAQGRKTVIVGMSRGGMTTAAALAGGAPADGVVLVSSNYGAIRGELGSAARLPPTLIVHHRRDACGPTKPASVQPFVAWAGGKARVAWFDNAGPEAPNPCGPRGAHGFYMDDGGPVAAIIQFIRSR